MVRSSFLARAYGRLHRLLRIGGVWLTRPSRKVAAIQVWAGVIADADEVGGRFCEYCAVAPRNDNPSPFSGVRSYALDPRGHERSGPAARSGPGRGSRSANSSQRAQPGPQAAGRMFWFTLNRFLGSYFFFTAASFG